MIAAVAVASQRSPFHAAWASALEPRGILLHRLTGLADLASLTVKVCIADLQLLAGDRRQQLAAVLSNSPGMRVVLGGEAIDPATELAALASGASACCDLHAGPDEMARVVDVVGSGGVWISRSALPLLVGKLQELSHRTGAAEVGAGGTATRDGSLDQLTAREREVAELIGQGASNKQIAQRLTITDRTVKAHLTSIFDKLGIADRLQLALRITGRK